MNQNESWTPRQVRLTGKVLHALGQGMGWAAKDTATGLRAFIGQQPLAGELPSKRAIDQIIRRFAKQELIRISKHRQYIAFELTDKGRQRLDVYMLDDLMFPALPQAWDGLWRIVLFDVPEERKHLRTIFRRKLQNLGFRLLQRSSWIYPFPCEKELSQLAKHLQLTSDVIVIAAQSLSCEAKFLEQFHLSRPKQNEADEDYHFIDVKDL